MGCSQSSSTNQVADAKAVDIKDSGLAAAALPESSTAETAPETKADGTRAATKADVVPDNALRVTSEAKKARAEAKEGVKDKRIVATAKVETHEAIQTHRKLFNEFFGDSLKVVALLMPAYPRFRYVRCTFTDGVPCIRRAHR
jgi:hypothetical protein